MLLKRTHWSILLVALAMLATISQPAVADQSQGGDAFGATTDLLRYPVVDKDDGGGTKDATGCSQNVCLRLESKGGSGADIDLVKSWGRSGVNPPASGTAYIDIYYPNGLTSNYSWSHGAANGWIMFWSSAYPANYPDETVICAGHTNKVAWPGYPCLTVYE